MRSIVAKDAAGEAIGSGFFFTEGPAWDAAHGCLHISDIPASVIQRWHGRRFGVIPVPELPADRAWGDAD